RNVYVALIREKMEEKNINCTVIEAENGHEVLGKIMLGEITKSDLFVIGGEMLFMNGPQLVKELRTHASGAYKDTPIFGFSRNDRNEEFETMKAVGVIQKLNYSKAESWLSYPANIAEFAEAQINARQK